ncbi:PqqD family protein [Pararhizobium haloflavum]|uniref:PqqD family protein n=1 Tax=Pararhizobium haloflavum TaxID=2037914 RepID=UPI0012FFFD3D|nr:PqqD family protein [Pararhizobium haloflavum]
MAFDDTGEVAELPDCPELLAAVDAAFGDWPHERVDREQRPFVSIRRTGALYAITTASGDELTLNAVGTANRLVVEVLGASIAANPERLCFHCASVRIGGRLVLFPSEARAGKSTLAAYLASQGHEIFGDDALALAPGDREGVALGLAPRLRRPLPPTLGGAARDYIERAGRIDDRRYSYLDLPGGRLAKRGEQAPLGALVLLDRRDDGPVEFFSAERPAMLRALIAQNFARAAPASTLIDRLHAVVERLPRYRLCYSDLEEAAAVLASAFASWPPRIAVAEKPETLGDGSDRSITSSFSYADIPPNLAFARSTDVQLRTVDGEMFLADDSECAIYHLNAVGVGIWNLLDQPTSRDEAASILAEAFPHVERAVIRDDVAAVYAALLDAGFIAPLQR